MKIRTHRLRRRAEGFALVLTLTLLALLVLAVLALSALVKVSGEVVLAGTDQLQARQHALLALDVALSDLAVSAGPDARLTGMAGITGIAAGANNHTRHWCGVWQADGSFIRWLASGAQTSAPLLDPGYASIALIAGGSVGASTANSEHVIAGKIPITVPETIATPGTAVVVGHYAYVVLDEGVKTSIYSPAPFPVVAPAIFANSTNAQSRLRDAVAAYSATLPKLLSYEQARVLPAPAASLAASTIWDNFHHATLTARFVTGTAMESGRFNVNTNSALVWRNIFETYNHVPGIAATIDAATVNARGTTAQNTAASYDAAGKRSSGPFTSHAAVQSFLDTLFPQTASPNAEQLMVAIGPMFTFRSDTFRLRAYGEVVNLSLLTDIKASALCEAIVQRTSEPAPNSLGNRFVVTYFRWLNQNTERPEDGDK